MLEHFVLPLELLHKSKIVSKSKQEEVKLCFLETVNGEKIKLRKMLTTNEFRQETLQQR